MVQMDHPKSSGIFCICKASDFASFELFFVIITKC